MKKIILLIAVLLLCPISVLAQEFDIQIINYNPETQYARIQIKNLASTDFHDVKMKIDDSAEISIVKLIKPDYAVSNFLTIPPGKHEITITTGEGTTLTKKLHFSQTQEQIHEEIEQQKQIVEQQEEIQEEIEKLAQQDISKPQPKKSNFKYLYIFLVLIALIIIYWLYKKYKYSQ